MIGVANSANPMPRPPASLVLYAFAAACLLGGISTPVTAQQNREQLLRQVEKEKDEVALSVLRQLAEPGDAKALKAMKRAVGVLRKAPRLSVAYQSFGRFEGRPDVEKDAVEFLYKEVQSRKPKLAHLAVGGLKNLMPAAEKRLFRILQEHKNELCRAKALGPLLSRIRQDRLPSTFALLLDNFVIRKTGTAAAFTETLELFALPDFRLQLEQRLSDPDFSSSIKQLILQVVAGPEGQGLQDLTLIALKDANPTVQLAALMALQQHNLTIPKSTLQRLAKHKDDAVRMTALVVLARQGDPSGPLVAQISKWAKSRDSAQRQAAANAYGLVPIAKSVPGLSKLMQDSSLAVRHDAILVLEQLRHPAALEALLPQVEHPNKITALAVQEALANLTGQNFGPSISTWARWWQDNRVGFSFPDPGLVRRKAAARERNAAEGRTGAAFFGLPVISRRVAFVLDTSDSMKAKFAAASKYGSIEGTRLSTAKAQLLAALKNLPDGTRFNIYTFDTRGLAWQKSLIALNKKSRIEARQFVKGLQTRGATAMYDALELAFQDQEVDSIFLLTDGMPFGGKIDDPNLIMNEIRRWNTTRRMPVHCVSIGGPIGLLKQIVQETSGKFIRVN
jgi:HEAT repeat protein